jgi:predicted TPR repeat methyltransferase
MNKPASFYYDKLAKYYEQATSAEGAWTPPKMIEKYIGDKILHNAMVLDIGIGTGQSSAFLLQRRLNPKIYGLDVSAEMLSVCREKYPEIILFNDSLEGFKSNNALRFDIIVSSGVFEFIEGLGSIFDCVSGLLAEGGRFIFTFEPHIEGHPLQSIKKSLVVANEKSSLYTEEFYTYRRSVDEVVSLLNLAGLKVDSREDFVAYQKENTNIIYTIIESSHGDNNQRHSEF